MDSPKPKRRWLRFSLRTMFVVVTVACVWLGYQVNWIRQRRELARESASVKSTYQNTSGASMVVLPALGSTLSQRTLILLGEPAMPRLYICYLVDDKNADVTREEDGTSRSRHPEEFSKIERVRHLFPEAEIVADSVDRELVEDPLEAIYHKLRGLISE